MSYLHSFSCLGTLRFLLLLTLKQDNEIMLICWGFPTRMVYLYYMICLRYTIVVGNPGCILVCALGLYPYCLPSQEALAEEKRMEARFLNDIEISKAQRDFELKKAAYDMEVQTTKAQADLAYDLQVRMGGGKYCRFVSWKVYVLLRVLLCIFHDGGAEC